MGEKEDEAAGSWGGDRIHSSGILVTDPPLQVHGREFSVWAFFVCGKDPLGSTGGEMEDGAGDLQEHLVQRFLQHEETRLACRPTSVIAADHCWEMNPSFCFVLP